MQATRIVASQERLIEKLRAAGLPTDKAEETLATFRDSLRSFEHDLAIADRECRTVLSRR